MADFEHLLTDMMAIKNSSRADRFAYTQTFADVLDSLIGDDGDDDDDHDHDAIDDEHDVHESSDETAVAQTATAD